MPVLTKLNEARAKFHATEIKKTGHNKFAGYYYFELGDFLVPALKIFNEVGLSGVVSFDKELATMTLTDLEDGSEFKLTSPMSSAALKGCHDVQNLGAVQTYLRRYLWVAALEIVEHDAIDSSEPVKPVKESSKSVSRAEFDSMSPEEQKYLRELADTIRGVLLSDGVAQAVKELNAHQLDSDEKVAIWSLFDSKERAAIKKFQQEQMQ